MRESLPCAIKLTVAIELTPEGKDFSHESNHPKSGESQEKDGESDANASARRETEATEKDCSRTSNSVRQRRFGSRLGTEIALKQRTVTVESQGWQAFSIEAFWGTPSKRLRVSWASIRTPCNDDDGAVDTTTREDQRLAARHKANRGGGSSFQAVAPRPLLLGKGATVALQLTEIVLLLRSLCTRSFSRAFSP